MTNRSYKKFCLEAINNGTLARPTKEQNEAFTKASINERELELEDFGFDSNAFELYKAGKHPAFQDSFAWTDEKVLAFVKVVTVGSYGDYANDKTTSAKLETFKKLHGKPGSTQETR